MSLPVGFRLYLSWIFSIHASRFMAAVTYCLRGARSACSAIVLAGSTIEVSQGDTVIKEDEKLSY